MENRGELEKEEKEARQAKHKVITTTNREKMVAEGRVCVCVGTNDAHRDCMRIVESSPFLSKFAFLPSSIGIDVASNAGRTSGERREPTKKREGGARCAAHNSERGEVGRGDRAGDPDRLNRMIRVSLE